MCCIIRMQSALSGFLRLFSAKSEQIRFISVCRPLSVFPMQLPLCACSLCSPRSSKLFMPLCQNHPLFQRHTHKMHCMIFTYILCKFKASIYIFHIMS